MPIPAAVRRHARLALGAYAAVNFAAFVAGAVFWYGDFFRAYPIPVWAYPFVPDCPLANGLFGLALMQIVRRRPSQLLNQAAAIACIKYGTWTMTCWLLYWARTGDYNPLSLLLFFTHLGLTAQGAILVWLPGRPNWRDTLIVLGWFVAGDIVDYAPIAPREGGYGWYPPVPLGTELVPALMAQAIAATGLLNGAMAVYTARSERRKKGNTPTQTRTAISGSGGRHSIP